MTDTLHEDGYISVFLRMRNVSDESCRENQNTHFTFNNSFENRVVYEIIEKKYCTVGQATDNNTAHTHFMLDNYGSSSSVFPPYRGEEV